MSTRHSSEFRRPQHSLFFAVMVPTTAVGAISHEFNHLQTQYPILKKRIPDDRLHLTLLNVFAADHLPNEIVQMSLAVGNAIRFVEYCLRLDRVLSYRNRQAEQPCVLTADAVSSQTSNKLANQIRRIFEVLSGHSMRRNRPINPHVTLVWDKCSIPSQFIQPIELPVREVTLIHSHVGKSRYEILGRWDLVPRQ